MSPKQLILSTEFCHFLHTIHKIYIFCRKIHAYTREIHIFTGGRHSQQGRQSLAATSTCGRNTRNTAMRRLPFATTWTTTTASPSLYRSNVTVAGRFRRGSPHSSAAAADSSAGAPWLAEARSVQCAADSGAGSPHQRVTMARRGVEWSTRDSDMNPSIIYNKLLHFLITYFFY
jgi:hypothetical protein